MPFLHCIDGEKSDMWKKPKESSWLDKNEPWRSIVPDLAPTLLLLLITMPPQIIVKVTYNSELKRISFMNAQTFTYSKLHAEVHAHIHAANNNLTDGRRCSPCGNKLMWAFSEKKPHLKCYRSL